VKSVAEFLGLRGDSRPRLSGRAKLGGSGEGRLKLQFEVNGQQYFLTFVEDERRWYVFAPSAQGTTRIPVYVDVKGERVSSERSLPKLSS
jgi:hypothetical protein